MVRSIAGFASLALFVSACSDASSSEASPHAVQAASTSPDAAAALDPTREGTLFHLEGRHGTPGSLWIETSYKIRRDAGKLSKTLELDIEHAPPGVTHALSLDGFALGKLITSAKGKAEYELTEAGEDYFPDGFEEPKEGSLVRVGELAEIRLQTVHKLTDLQVDIAGPGTLAGKVGYKIERLGETVTTEFQVKVTGAGAKSVHPVKIDGVHVGDLNVDLAGKGKLLYSTLEGEPFPSGFQAPRAGVKVQVGTLYEGRLRDNLGVSE
jgi:hypothetical protein